MVNVHYINKTGMGILAKLVLIIHVQNKLWLAIMSKYKTLGNC